MKHYIIVFLSCISIIIFVLMFKQYIYFDKAEKYKNSRNYIKAIDNYTMVIYMHIPFSPLEKKSIKNIIQIAKLYEKSKRLYFTLYAYERLRSAIFGIRWIKTPHSETLKDINSEIARLRTVLLIKDGYKKGFQKTHEEIKKVMKRDLAPNPIISLISIFSFFSFVGYTILLITTQSFSFKKGAVILFFLSFWLLTLYLA